MDLIRALKLHIDHARTGTSDGRIDAAFDLVALVDERVIPALEWHAGTAAGMEGTIEKWAIRMALGNNGGAWATHYTEDQKNHWRKLAREMLDDAAGQISVKP